MLTTETMIAEAPKKDEPKMPGGGMPGMGDMGGMHHEGADTAVTVNPGETKDLTTTFDRAGTVIIGCHQPGHYEAGMKATVTVS